MSVIRAIAAFLCGLLALGPCTAQYVTAGPCPKNIQAMQNFDASRYLGRWYEAKKYFFLFEFAAKCITADYSLKENGAIGVVNKQISELTGMPSEIRGEATQAGRSDEGKLTVRFSSLPVDIPAPYWVVDTDYDNYSLVWSCFDLGIFHATNSWILTRKRNVSEEVLNKALQAADENHIARSYFDTTDQTGCPEKDLDNVKQFSFF